ncbi:hypothetical protein ACIA8K_11645 [Catenuloplanes sp. NPDC051500]|uniref:hypothetical protein n=1 Tax=Catenuloplanes sp. NPDC051500 TaxID=3363959 RepID=UPI003794C7B1
MSVTTNVVDWLGQLDYGTVPAWLGALSLLLAYRIFHRDRISSDRAQVDLVGFWAVPSWDRRSPMDAMVETCEIERFVRNGSQLPVDVHQVAFDVRTQWCVRDLEQWSDDFPVWEIKEGTDLLRYFQGLVRVPPEETYELGAQPINVAHLAPAHAGQLDPLIGLSYEVRWMLISDNAGRRWEVRPGRSTRRIRWFSRRRAGYPANWHNPYSVVLRTTRAWTSTQVGRIKMGKATG